MQQTLRKDEDTLSGKSHRGKSHCLLPHLQCFRHRPPAPLGATHENDEWRLSNNGQGAVTRDTNVPVLQDAVAKTRVDGIAAIESC